MNCQVVNCTLPAHMVGGMRLCDKHDGAAQRLFRPMAERPRLPFDLIADIFKGAHRPDVPLCPHGCGVDVGTNNPRCSMHPEIGPRKPRGCR